MAAGGFGLLDFADQRAALFGKYRRRILKLGAFGLDLGDAGLDGFDLRGRAGLAALPFVALGGDRLQAAVRQLGLARQRLRFGPHLRGDAAKAVNAGSNLGEPGFGVQAGGQFGQRRMRALKRALGLAAVGRETGVGFGQRRLARGVAVDLALGRGMTFARAIGFALGGAPCIARRSLAGGSRPEFGLGGLERLPLGAGVDAGLLQFVLDVDETGALGEPPCRAGRRMGGGDEAIPAPDVAFQRHQPLAGLEPRHQRRASFARDDADLRQAARQFGGRFDMRRERLDALRQRGIALGHAGIGPAHRRRRIDRRIEIVAERGAERLLISLGDGDAVDDRRPQILGLAVDELGNRARFGLEPLHALVGFVERRAGGFQPGAGGDVAGLAGLRRAFGLREALLRGFHGGGERREVAQRAGFLRELLLVACDIGDILVEPRQPVAVGVDIALELVAPGGQVGERGGQLGEQPLGGGQRGFGFGDAAIDAAALLDARFDLFLQLGVFGAEPLQRGFRIGGLLLLAGDVGRKLRQPAVELGDALLGALFLAIQRFARIGEPLQSGGGAGLGLAQRRQFRGAHRLDAGRLGLFAGAFGHLADAEVVGLRSPPIRRHWPPASADETAAPRPCAPWPRLRGSGSPAAPASSGRRSARPAAR